MVNSRSPYARTNRCRTASEGGAFFHTRVGTPRIVTVSISKRAPGAVKAALASSSDILGQSGSSGTIGSRDKRDLSKSECWVWPGSRTVENVSVDSRRAQGNRRRAHARRRESRDSNKRYARSMKIARPESEGFDSARLARIDTFLKARYLDSGKLPHAQLLVARSGNIVHFSHQGPARDGG